MPAALPGGWFTAGCGAGVPGGVGVEFPATSFTAAGAAARWHPAASIAISTAATIVDCLTIVILSPGIACPLTLHAATRDRYCPSS
ncbi:hypothetical protein XAB3213_4200005 [Xanthomonas citri pv. bilvae]|nr:hypothetical protein XAB3213_4200005 [Xanthomonas citri pv. bilvae]